MATPCFSFCGGTNTGGAQTLEDVGGSVCVGGGGW